MGGRRGVRRVTPPVPAQVRVLAVGLERYAYGDALDLPGAATEAVRFARWAIGHGVPPNNVVLACSWQGDQAPADPIPGARTAATTRDGLEEALQQLVGVGGELLLVYWCGHGLVNEERDRVLLTANAKAENQSNISVTEILALLASDKGNGFARQILLIDACANFATDLRIDDRLPRLTLAKGKPREVDQFALFAAEQGQVAEFNKQTRRGAFTEAALGWLDDNPAQGLDIDLTALRQHVANVFAARSESGAFRQVPVQFVTDRLGGDKSWLTYGGLPTAAAVQADAVARGLAVSQVRRLARLVAGLELVDDARRPRLIEALNDAATASVVGSSALYPVDSAELAALHASLVQAFAAGRGQAVIDALIGLAASDTETLEIDKVRVALARQLIVAGVVGRFGQLSLQEVRAAHARAVPDDDRVIVNDLEEALENAARYGYGITASPLHRLVVMLEQLAGTEVADEWFDIPSGELADLRADARSERPNRPSRLVIDLRTPGPPGGVARWPSELRAVLLHDGEWTPLDPVPCQPADRLGVGQATQQLLDQAYERGVAKLAIGFIANRAVFAELPETLLYEEWAGPRPLAELHPVVLHSAERLTAHRPKALWRERAEQIRTRLLNSPPDVAWLDAADNRPELIRARINASLATCVALTFAPEHWSGDLRTDPIMAAIGEGAPFVVWVDDDQVDGALLRDRVVDLVSRGAFEDLPVRVHTERTAGASAPPMVRVLWDDPTALPLNALPGLGS
jgi:hypothetical protein